MIYYNDFVESRRRRWRPTTIKSKQRNKCKQYFVYGLFTVFLPQHVHRSIKDLTQFDYKSPKINCGSDFRSDRGRNKTSLYYYQYRAVCYFCLDEIPRQIQFVSSTLLSRHARYTLYTIMAVSSGRRVGVTISYIYFIYHAHSLTRGTIFTARHRDTETKIEAAVGKCKK